MALSDERLLRRFALCRLCVEIGDDELWEVIESAFVGPKPARQ
jgi:hypothetical protein